MKTRSLEIQSRKHIGTELLGRFKSISVGQGIEFRDFREYSLGDDAKHIDWLASAKEQTLITRRHDEERDSTLQLIIDECESVYYEANSPKNTLKKELISLIGQAAISSRMRLKGWKLGEDTRELFAHKNPQLCLAKLLQKSQNIPRTNTPLTLREFVLKKHKKSLIIIISDSLEVDEMSLKALALVHDVIYLHLSSQFENTLELDGIQTVQGKQRYTLNLGNEILRNRYIQERRKKLDAFRKKLLSYKIRTGIFESGTDPVPELIHTLDTRF